ncbi:glycosyltransferase family 4 protein [Streptococcus caprae]|uniref:Glycosyltransferase family 4 protein n=1 Tax=Streptococcus caprae TaxID=1640501 RepID=A0ABV8CWR3_9STRE
MGTFTIEYVLVLIGTLLISLVLTPVVRFIAPKIGAVDNPNARRINKVPMPSGGGIAIVISFTIATLILMPIAFHDPYMGHYYFDYMLPVVLGGLIIAITGFVDDIKELSAKWKMLGIVLGAVVIALFTDFQFDSFKIPFGGPLIEFNPFVTFLVTVIWIVGITNAVNFLDGLDGLVSGVAIISMTTMGLISNFFLFDSDYYLTLTIFVLIMAIAGFFPYNYHPAIIYLGDTGSLYIGFMIAVLSLQGLKNATAVAVVSPMIVLGVPIVDTLFAILRRQLSGKKFYEPDRMHLHHRLLSMGFTHRGAVLVVYGIAIVFSLISLLLNVSSRWGGILMLLGFAFMIEIFLENIELMGKNRKPLMNTLKFIGNSSYRQEVLENYQKKSKK